MDDEELEEEAFLAAWAAADENALEVLLEALPHVPTDAVLPLAELHAAVARIRTGVTSPTWPYTYFTAAADWAPAPPHDDLQCFLDAIVSTMLPEAYPDDEWTDDELARSPRWSTRTGSEVSSGPYAPVQVRPRLLRLCSGTSTGAQSSRAIGIQTTTS